MYPDSIPILKQLAFAGVILLFVLAIRKGHKKVDGYKKLLLQLNLIPATSTENLRTRNSPAKWRQISKRCIWLAGNRCKICRTKYGQKHCHEEWSFYEGIQRLLEKQCLCTDCHDCKHIGRIKSRDRKRYYYLIEHLARVNGKSIAYIESYVEFCLERVAYLSKKYPRWTVITKDFPTQRQRRSARQRMWG